MSRPKELLRKPMALGYRGLVNVRMRGVRKRDRKDMATAHAVLASVLRPGSHCIDVGANEGQLLRWMVELAPEGRHVAVEAIPSLAQVLRTRFPSVEVIEAAAGDHDHEATFYVATNVPGYSGLRVQDYPRRTAIEPITVPVLRLVDHLPDRRFDLVKIDVEGAERSVLEGLVDLLVSDGPLVLLEHSARQSQKFGDAPTDVHDVLARAGYVVFDIDGAGPLTSREFERSSLSGEVWTYLARPAV